MNSSSNSRLLPIVAALVVALVASLASSSAEAKKRRSKKSSASAAASAPSAKAAGRGKKPRSKPIAVVSPQGSSKDAPIRTAIGKILKQHKVKTKVLSGKRAEKAFPKDEATPSNSGWAKIAQDLKVDGFVEYTLTRAGGKSQVDVFVRSGADGSVVGQETFSAKGAPKKVAKAVTESFWEKLGSAVQEVAAGEKPSGGLPPRDLAETQEEAPSKGAAREEPERAAPKREEPPKETEEPPRGETKQAREEEAEPGDKAAAAPKRKEKEEEEEEGETPAHPPGELSVVDIELDLRFLRRLWEYNPVTAASRYFLSFYTPVVGGRASWFPLRNLGVYAGGEASIGMKSVGFPTSEQELQFGGQFRFPLSFGQIGASAGYFQQYFLIKDSAVPGERSMLQVPNTVYRGARLAVGAKFHIGGRILTGLEVAYRLVTTAGEDTAQVKSPQYFPNSAAPVAVDANAFVAAHLGSLGGWTLDARAGADYRRYAFGRLQTAQTAVVQIDAGGALDEYLVLYLGVGGVMGGK